MADEELTLEDKARLLGSMDSRKWDDYDKKFYKQLISQDALDLAKLDAQIRRALLLYTTKFSEMLLQTTPAEDLDIHNTIATTLLQGLTQGYELGRKLRRPLTAKRGRS